MVFPKRYQKANNASQYATLSRSSAKVPEGWHETRPEGGSVCGCLCIHVSVYQGREPDVGFPYAIYREENVL